MKYSKDCTNYEREDIMFLIIENAKSIDEMYELLDLFNKDKMSVDELKIAMNVLDAHKDA